MRSDFLATLHCPYTGLPLSLSYDLDGGGEEIDYGIVSTEATDFPIVEGILRLHVDEHRESIVQHVREGRRREALAAALDRGPFGGRTSAAIQFASSFALKTGFKGPGNALNKLKRNFVRVLSDSGASFAEIVQKLSTDHNRDHQMYRFTMPGFLSTFALAHAVRPEGWVLSFACGTGHEPFLISRMWPNTKIVCADYSFCALYIAKNYFAPEASYVCLDGDYLLPFESGQFSTIFSSDTLPILDSKLNLVQEFRRIGDQKAVTLLPHMHNRLVWPFAESLTPHGYRQLFRDIDVRLFPDDKIVRDYFFDDVLDLSNEWTDEELAVQHLSVVACKDSSVFRRAENLWPQRLATFRNPSINPAYRVTGEPGNWRVRSRAGDYYRKTITDGEKICLPDTWRVTTRSLETLDLIAFHRTDPGEFTRLARLLIILDLPERFWRRSQTLRQSSELLAARQQTAV